MSQFEPTGEQIARELDLERYGDPEKARMRAALEAIQAVIDAELNHRMGSHRTVALYTALGQIDQLARQGLAP